jgi:glycosyltransferase involved in cell wall biosynthesis
MPDNHPKQKLIFIITKSDWGGAGRYVYDLATSLAEEYDVAVALGGEGALKERLSASGIRLIPIASLGRNISTLKDVRAFFELFRILKKERPAVVHLNSSKAGGLGALAAQLAGVNRVVFTVHGWAYNEPVPALSKLFRWTASLATVLLSDKVITVSDFDRTHTPLGLSATTIHNGIAETAFLPREEARARLNIPGETRHTVIGTVAELHRNKGVDILLNALVQIPEAVLVVVGDGEERRALEAQIKRLRLEERVELKGFVPDAASLLKAFDLFVLASRKEGLPYVLLEAGAAGTPVIASTVGGIPEIVDDGLTGALFPAYDAAALAKTANELIAAPATRAHYADRLKEEITRYFGLRGMVKRTSEVYGGR